MPVSLVYYIGHIDCKKHSYSKQTMNSKLKKTMGDLDVETKRWNRRVKSLGYTLITKYECDWEKDIADNDEIQKHVDNLGTAGAIGPRSALFGGRTETFCLHAIGDTNHPIRYIDVVRIHPFVLLLLFKTNNNGRQYYP